MNLDNALSAHSEWKVKLRAAILKKEKLDARAIHADNCCDLGKWLHGDARRQFSGKSAYLPLVQKHKEFHQQAGRVADAINAEKFDDANAALGAGTDFAKASSAVGVAINALKKEIS
jgi:methyl-accepting chemotaxis protein